MEKSEPFRQGIEAALSALLQAKQHVIDEEEFFGAEGLVETLVAATIDILEENGLYES